MRTWVIDPNRTGFDSLVLGERDIPEPGPGQVRLAVKAASINYRDQVVLNGDYGQVVAEEIIPLSDAAGVIDATGPGVDEWSAGDRVVTVYSEGWIDGPPPVTLGFGLGSPGIDGVLAEYIVIAADRVAAMPTSLSFAQASTLTCAGLTAWTALMAEHPVETGQTVLTLGTGGVSVFALQLATAMGATVIATTSRKEKEDRLRELGASRVINHRIEPNWGGVVYAETGGADKVVNTAGGDAMTQSIMAVGGLGEIAVMGLFPTSDTSDTPPPLPVLMSRAASIRGTTVGGSAAMGDLISFVDAHDIKPVIQATFDFADARDAYQAQAGPDVFGKIVIKVAP